VLHAAGQQLQAANRQKGGAAAPQKCSAYMQGRPSLRPVQVRHVAQHSRLDMHAASGLASATMSPCKLSTTTGMSKINKGCFKAQGRQSRVPCHRVQPATAPTCRPGYCWLLWPSCCPCCCCCWLACVSGDLSTTIVCLEQACTPVLVVRLCCLYHHVVLQGKVAARGVTNVNTQPCMHSVCWGNGSPMVGELCHLHMASPHAQTRLHKHNAQGSPKMSGGCVM
jgi:hypothetical protein